MFRIELIVFSESLSFVHDFRQVRMEAVSQVCDAHLTSYFELGTNHTDHTIFDTLRDVAISFNDTMFHCKWRNDINYCQKYFKPILTEEGVCFTFNVLNSKEIYNEGYVIRTHCSL